MPDWSQLSTHVEQDPIILQDVFRVVNADADVPTKQRLRNEAWFAKICIFDLNTGKTSIRLLTSLWANPAVNGEVPDEWAFTRYTSAIFPLIRHQAIGKQIEYKGKILGAIISDSEYKRSDFGKLLLSTHSVATGCCQVNEHGELLGDPGEAPPIAAVVVRPPATGRMSELIQLSDTPQISAMHLSYNESVIIEGPPGSGKTSIALHRIPVLIDNQLELPGRANRQDPFSISPQTCRVLIQNPEMVSYLQTLTHHLQLSTIPSMTLEDFFRDEIYQKSKLEGLRNRRDPSSSSSALRQLRSQRRTVDVWVTATRGTLSCLNATTQFRLALQSAVAKFLVDECRRVPLIPVSADDFNKLLADLKRSLAEVPATVFDPFVAHSLASIAKAQRQCHPEAELPKLSDFKALRNWGLAADQAVISSTLESLGLSPTGDTSDFYRGMWDLLNAVIGLKSDAFVNCTRSICTWILESDGRMRQFLTELSNTINTLPHAGLVRAVEMETDAKFKSRSAYEVMQSLLRRLGTGKLPAAAAENLRTLVEGFCLRCEFIDESIHVVASAILKRKPSATASIVKVCQKALQPFSSQTKIVQSALDGLSADWQTQLAANGELDVRGFIGALVNSTAAIVGVFPEVHRSTFTKMLQSGDLTERMREMALALRAETEMMQDWIKQLPDSCDPHGQIGRRWPCYSKTNRRKQGGGEWSVMVFEAVESTLIQALTPANIIKHISENSGKYFEGTVDPLIREWVSEYQDNSYNPDDFALFAATAMATMLERPDQTDPHIPYIAHIVIDEGQDAYPSQLQVIEAVMGPKGTCTVVGDLNQRVVDFAPFAKWSELLPVSRRAEFSVNYRQSLPLSEFTRACLTAIAEEPPSWVSDKTRSGPLVRVVESSPTKVSVISDEVHFWRRQDAAAVLAVICVGLSKVEQSEVVAEVRRTVTAGTPVKELSGGQEAYIPRGIIVADVSYTRGMEFTFVVLVVKAPPEVDDLESWSPTARNQLYIGASRAISGLSIALHDDNEWLKDVSRHLPKELQPIDV